MPYDAQTPLPGYRGNYELLIAAAGVHLSLAERASLRALAGSDQIVVRHLAAILARARNARPVVEMMHAVPSAPLPQWVADVMDRYGAS
jgi:hypothetical protein